MLAMPFMKDEIRYRTLAEACVVSTTIEYKYAVEHPVSVARRHRYEPRPISITEVLPEAGASPYPRFTPLPWNLTEGQCKASMGKPPPSYQFPQAYTQIRLSHHPPSSDTATPTILVTLDRPTQYNAFTDTMCDELCAAFADLDGDDRVKCVVITGAKKDGGKDMFCAGADLVQGFSAGKARGGDDDGRAGREHRDGWADFPCRAA